MKNITDCLIPKVKHSLGVMVWGCFTRNRIGSLIRLDGSITGEVYKSVLRDHLLPFKENWILQKFGLFKMIMPGHTEQQL